MTRTGDLVYGIELENSAFIFKKDKVELLINIYDWKLCILALDLLMGYLHGG